MFEVPEKVGKKSDQEVRKIANKPEISDKKVINYHKKMNVINIYTLFRKIRKNSQITGKKSRREALKIGDKPEISSKS